MTLDSAPRPEHADLGFDPDALREKYRQERDKRLRSDGNDQYQQIAGDLGLSYSVLNLREQRLRVERSYAASLSA